MIARLRRKKLLGTDHLVEGLPVKCVSTLTKQLPSEVVVDAGRMSEIASGEAGKLEQRLEMAMPSVRLYAQAEANSFQEWLKFSFGNSKVCGPL
jgi:hypothetical protein